MKFDVYGIGNALLDIEFDISEDFLKQAGIEKGLMTLVDHKRHHDLMDALGYDNIRKKSSGGSAANTMVALQQLGGNGFYSCLVANDVAGDHYLEDLHSTGLHSNFLHQERSDETTGKCISMVTPDGERTMNSYLGISESLSPNQLHHQALENSDVFYIEGYLTTSTSAMAAVLEGKALAKEQGAKIALSLSDPGIVKFFKKQFESIIDDGIDMIFCNEDEAKEFTGKTQLEDIISTLKQCTKTFALTRGAQGSILFDGQQCLEIRPYPTTMVDATGAGDMYAGGVLYGLSHGMSWAQAGDLASRAASMVVSQYGARLSDSQIANIKQHNLAEQH